MDIRGGRVTRTERGASEHSSYQFKTKNKKMALAVFSALHVTSPAAGQKRNDIKWGVLEAMEQKKIKKAASQQMEASRRIIACWVHSNQLEHS